jgi:hypothetical protein
VRLHPTELVGMRWQERVCGDEGCVGVTYRVVAATQDTSESTMPEYSDNGDVWLYQVQHTTAAGPAEGDWLSTCGSDGGEPVRRLFVDGRWGPDGSFDPRGYTFSCPTGVVSKCVGSWGYKPWKAVETGDGRRVDLGPLHRACVRAARADYCGDGVPHTRDGTLVDMLDIYGLNVREGDTGFESEATFDPDGATWMAKERWPERGARNLTEMCDGMRRNAGGGAPLITVWSNTAALER